MRHVWVIGIGAGDPRQITIEAIEALNRADVLFEIERGATELTAVRAEICRRYVTGRPRVVTLREPRRDRGASSYAEAVRDWRSGRADVWERALREELGDGQSGAFLVWGDPSVYDSTIAVLDELAARDTVAMEYSSIPGISSIHALTARHGITLNRVAGAVQITTGRRLAEQGWPESVDDVVVMLDGRCAFATVTEPGVEIFWGAYLGTADELLVAGPLADVADEIERVRAQARERIGWVMDCYLLRRR